MNLFRIECLVPNKKVGDALGALDGIAVDLKVVPVRNATVKNGSVAETGEATATDAVLRLIEKVKAEGHKSFSVKEVREHCAALGFSQHGYSYGVNKLLKSGVLKKSRKVPRTFEVV